MPRHNDRLVVERQQLFLDRDENPPRVSAGEIGSSDAVAKQRISGDQLFLSVAVETDAAWGVPRRVANHNRRR